MGTKRPFTDLGAPDLDQDLSAVHPDRRDPAPKRIKHGSKVRHKAKEGSAEWAKKRVRTVERLFNRNQDLPADVRNDLEREVAAHRTTIGDRAFQKKRSSMISRYHKIRFFERKKAMRLGKQLRRKIEETSDSDERAQLQADLHIAEVDEAYAVNFPHAEPYISLYRTPKSDDPEEVEGDEQTPSARAALKAERPPMWSTVETAMREGPAALTRLRERRSHTDESSANRPPKATPRERRPAAKQPEQPATNKPAVNEKDGRLPQPNRRERRRLMHRDAPAGNKSEDDDGAGGFFEE